MRIGFDAKKLVSNLTGIGNYSRALVNLLSADGGDDCVLFAPGEGRGECLAQVAISPHVSKVVCGAKGPVGRAYWRNFGMVGDIRREGLDVFHGLSNELPFGIAKAGVPSAVTIHDLIFLRYPETYDWASRNILTLKTRYACRNATRVLAISECTKRDIVDFYGISPEKISVVLQGCDPVFARRATRRELSELRMRYNLPGEFILSVGTIERRKNHETIIRALAQTHSHVPLIILSKPTRMQQRLEALIREMGLQNRARIINWVPFSDLWKFYQASQAVIYLSYFEGFGLPVLEGITSGVPVIAATGSCLEEAGGEGAVYCSPFDAEEVAEAIDNVVADSTLRTRLMEGGHRHVALFTDEAIRTSMRNFYATL